MSFLLSCICCAVSEKVHPLNVKNPPCQASPRVEEQKVNEVAIFQIQKLSTCTPSPRRRWPNHRNSFSQCSSLSSSKLKENSDVKKGHRRQISKAGSLAFLLSLGVEIKGPDGENINLKNVDFVEPNQDQHEKDQLFCQEAIKATTMDQN